MLSYDVEFMIGAQWNIKLYLFFFRDNVFIPCLYFSQIVLDYNELKNIPYIRETIESFNQDCPGVRSDLCTLSFLPFVKKNKGKHTVNWRILLFLSWMPHTSPVGLRF